MSAPSSNASALEQIDAIINGFYDWRGKTLAMLRLVVRKAYPWVIEEVKWKKPSNPSGVPVWSHNGIICIANVLKNAVRFRLPVLNPGKRQARRRAHFRDDYLR